jgi:predicted acyl esterase
MEPAADFKLIMRAGVHPDVAVPRPPPPHFSETREDQLQIARNVPVRLRDDVRIYIDVYRPADADGRADLPVLLGWSPYGKHRTAAQLPWPAADVQTGWISRHTALEAPDPAYW